MRRLIVAIAAAWGCALVGPGLPGPTDLAVLGHAQLASSSPAAGTVLETSPSEIRLIFSEPPQPGYSSLDLLDGEGRALLLNVGAVDPADPYAIVAPVDGLPSGAYTVNWRAVSAADGHQTSGFLNFGVGDVALATNPAGPVGEGPHSGHGASTAALEVVAKTLGYAGSMIAFGLLLIAFVAVRPAIGGIPSGLTGGMIAVLVASGFGAVLLAANALDDAGAVSGAAVDPLAFVGGTRIGGILGLRAVLAFAGAGAVALLAAFGRRSVAVLAGGVVGAIEIVLIAAMGHADAFTSSVPLIAAIVHMGAGGIWLAGIAGFAAVVLIEGQSSVSLRPVVARFSALALVSVALIAATGLYASWVLQRELVSVATPYGIGLAIKVALVLGALGLGALNYLTGYDSTGERSRLNRLTGGFDRRIVVEAVLAAAVLGATANLTSGSPPSGTLPVPIAPAVGTTQPLPGLGLGVQPGRPGPSTIWVTIEPAAAIGTRVALELTQLDASTGSSRISLEAVPAPPAGIHGSAYRAGAILPGSSRWDATVIVSSADGQELGREQFAFALDATGISEGRAAPPLDPVIIIAIVLLGAAVVGLGYLLGGGSLPRVERAAGRLALAGGCIVGGLLGLVLLVGGSVT